MLNSCQFIGRVSKDVEIRHMQSGDPVANISIAVGEKYTTKSGEKKESTEWIDVTCFAKGLCKVFENYVKKGDLIHVSGKWQTRNWDDAATGVKRYKTELVITGFNGGLVMLGDKKDQSAPQQSSAGYGAPQGGYDEPQGAVPDLDDDGSGIPF